MRPAPRRHHRPRREVRADIRVVAPQDLAALCVDRVDDRICRRYVDDLVDDDWRRRDAVGRRDVGCPGEPEIRDVVTVDPGQRAVVLAARIAAFDEPVRAVGQAGFQPLLVDFAGGQHRCRKHYHAD